MTTERVRAPPRLLLRFGVIFPLLAGGVIATLSYLPAGMAARSRVVDGLVGAAEILLPLVGYRVHRDARDPRILRAADGHGVKVAEECDALVPTVLLLAAGLVSPVPRRRRLLFLGAGAVGMFLLNQARIGHLLWLSQADPDAFRSAHESWWPAGLLLAAAGAFLLWARAVAPDPAVTEP